MQALTTVLLVVMILTAITMVGLILIQHGKGADMGAAFGSGSSGSLFGASGSANFLSRATAVLAAVFFACTLSLAYFGYDAQPADSGSVLERAAPAAPAAPPSPASQIPGGGTPVPAQQGPATTPATAAPVAPAAPPTPASPEAGSAGQIPTR